MGCSSQQSGSIHTSTETQRVRLCAQLVLLAERAPGFYLETFFTVFFITVRQLLFMNKVSCRAMMMTKVYCLVVREREMLSPWEEMFCPFPCLLMSLLSLMLELRPRVSPCHVPSSLMQNTRDQTEPHHEEHRKGKDWAGLGKKEPWRDKVLGHVACD